MAQETLKITITADNQQAVKNIQETVTATTKLGTAFKTLPSTSNQATNALTNLSRVAQDAPYGFIGIANNLNPLLESFQRLKVEAGSTGGALKAMAGGLMGPAGIGLALGAVSSIIVAFGPKIADFISGTNEATKAEEKFTKSLSDARASATETGIRLQAYLTVSENASVSEERRADALKLVVSELSKVNSSYASTITNVDQARAAVDLYTQALVNQAITSRYIDELATKTIALADANKKIIQSGRDYYDNLEKQKNAYQGVTGVAIGYQLAIKNAQDANKEARVEAEGLKNEIIGTTKQINNLVIANSANPFGPIAKGASDAANETDRASKSIEKLGKQARVLNISTTENITTKRTIKKPKTPNRLDPELPMFAQQYMGEQILKNEYALKAYNEELQFARTISDGAASAFETMFQAMANGENIGKALEESFKQIIIQLTAMIAKALIFEAIMASLGLPSGGGGTFANFIPSGSSNNGGGVAVLRGQDLLVAVSRTQQASALKGQNISLA